MSARNTLAAKKARREAKASTAPQIDLDGVVTALTGMRLTRAERRQFARTVPGKAVKAAIRQQNKRNREAVR